jgi:hypothetical protein
MPESLPDLVARLRATTPALADVPDELGVPTFRTSNEKDAGGAAVVRETPSAWTKAATIGAPGIGDRYPLASVGEILASANPLKLLAEYVTGPGRPRSVQAADPIGIDAFTQGKGPMPLLMGTTEDVGGIRAYHGSPHDFAQFDASKIGTGEGAQAYGHGLYFAEREGTAKAYRDQLADAGKVELYGQEYPVPPWRGDMDPHTRLVRHLGDARSLPSLRDVPDADVVAHVRQNILDEIANPFADKVSAQRELELLDRAAAHPAGITTKPGGKMYEVAIKADPAHFLDWDAPLSAQSPQVQEALQRMRDAGVLGDEFGVATTGEQLMRSKGVIAPEHNLKQAGVPGIKYLDQGSRAAGEGSRNYVVFDDKLIDILRKYGLLAPLAGASVGEALRSAPDPRQQ